MLGGAYMVTLWPRSPAPDPTNFAWSFFFSLFIFLFSLPSLLLSLCRVTLGEGMPAGKGRSVKASGGSCGGDKQHHPNLFGSMLHRRDQL